ncbi:MFS transporter [Radiobacillus deserti]|uniref:MFS transporter n=1 Tax=Radiobacillus deserti TaxID=2594883 RepID=A0A516KD51_9BACI|nr:MFS transporter [Radiobacillus deserti]QDP39341.1 MFS transporter [Radiobacillus deserti]
MEIKSVRFWILISLVTISGFSQGMLLPLLAIILEQNGVSSSVNGLHATGLYIGVLIASPFMEKPMQKLGYKPIILIGGALVIVSLAIFPLWQALWFWFILRILIGIGDHMLHFGTQTWITTSSSAEKRGRNISFYGLFFSLGFAIGPTTTQLLKIHESLPFILSSLLCLSVWILMWFVRNEWTKEEAVETTGTKTSLGRFWKTWKLAWVSLLPPFAYGVLESTLNGIFPIYGLRLGHDVSMLSIILPCFAAASMITQIPLGIVSDKIGRRKLLLFVIGGGILTFYITALVEHSAIGLLVSFSVAGMLVGSVYSLGISYMTDILPKTLLPAGNIMCGIAFSIGSISGPYLGGLYIDVLPNSSFFYVIMALLLVVFVAIAGKKTEKPAMVNAL